jgi:hypothetical protein
VVDRMRGDKDGFWLVLFLTTSESRAELPGILKWARETWDVKVDDSNRPMHVLYCKPLSAR